MAMSQKNECLNALMVEDNRFNVKECDLVANVLKWKNQWQLYYARYNKDTANIVIIKSSNNS